MDIVFIIILSVLALVAAVLIFAVLRGSMDDLDLRPQVAGAGFVAAAVLGLWTQILATGWPARTLAGGLAIMVIGLSLAAYIVANDNTDNCGLCFVAAALVIAGLIAALVGGAGLIWG